MAKIKYSFLMGIAKSIKNNLVIWLPAILAFLAGVPEQYVPIASVLAYLVKNYIEVKIK